MGIPKLHSRASREREGTVKTCESTSGPLHLRKQPRNNHKSAENQGLKCGLPLWLLLSLLSMWAVGTGSALPDHARSLRPTWGALSQLCTQAPAFTFYCQLQ